MQIHTYSFVQKLRKKKQTDKRISETEKAELKKYINRKSEVADLPEAEWSEIQLLKSERLLQQLQADR